MKRYNNQQNENQRKDNKAKGKQRKDPELVDLNQGCFNENELSELYKRRLTSVQTESHL